MRNKNGTGFHRVLVVILAAMLPMGAGCSNPHTPAGHEGYVFEQPRVFGEGGFRGTIVGPGNFGTSAWRNKVVNIDTRPTTYSETFRILAKDDLNVAFQVHLVLDVAPNEVKAVVERYGGTEWYGRFVREPFRTIVRQSVQTYSSSELKSERQTLSEVIEKEMRSYLADAPFHVVKLAVGNIDYPAVVSQAVEKKLASRQLLEEKATQREIAQRDAEIRIEEAKGIAEAQKIINATLTPYYLQHEAIEAQKTMAAAPNHTTVYIPVGNNGLPLVQTP